MRFKSHFPIILCLVVLAMIACGGSGLATAPPTVQEQEPTSTPEPEPTDTPAPVSEPILLTGSGSDVVDVDKTSSGALVHVTGNADGRHFSVTSYGAGNEKYDLLVNTTDPYDGVRPLDFLDDEHTTRFEVKAIGSWTIEIIPLNLDKFRDEGRLVTVPGSYSGTGSDVFFVSGDCDTATITGNDAGRHFSVHAWHGSGRDLLVNTTDPFQGTVLMTKDTSAVEVVAVGPWSVDVAAP